MSIHKVIEQMTSDTEFIRHTSAAIHRIRVVMKEHSLDPDNAVDAHEILDIATAILLQIQ